MAWPESIGWIDAAMVLLVVVSVLIGAARGLTFEVLSLLGWFAAWFAGLWLGPAVASWLPVGEAGSALNRGAGFASAFIVVLVLWSLGARAVSSLMAATPLRPIDRLLGAVFGLARAAVVLLVVALAVGWTPLARSDAWRASHGAAGLETALRALLPLVAPRASPVGAANRV